MNGKSGAAEIIGATAAGDSEDLAPELGFDEARGFDGKKAPGAFRTIGEVAKALGIRQHVLRYWEEQFPMLSPVKRSGNRRYYRPQDIELIETIDRLVHHQGYTLRGARLALETQKGVKRAPISSSAKAVSSPAENGHSTISGPAPDASAWLTELRAIRATLAAALDA